jgi:hypothetical protein
MLQKSCDGTSANPFHLDELRFDEFKVCAVATFKGQCCRAIERSGDELNFVANEKRVGIYFIALAWDVEDN